MDRKSIIVIVACMGLMFLWLNVLVPKLYPPLPVKPPPPGATNASAAAQAPASDINAAAPAPAPRTFIRPAFATNTDTPSVVLTNENARYTFTAIGGGLSEIALVKYPEVVSHERKGSPPSTSFATLNAHAQLPVLAVVGSEVWQGDGVFALTHTYTGYPMVKQARYMAQQGLLGKINKVVVEYPQGWLAGFLESGVSAATMWRTDPQKAGISLCMGDIGIHAENLGRYITGLEVEKVGADLSRYLPGNLLDDDVNILVNYKGGAKGIISASQISTGEENGLNILVYGTKLSIYWNQENPNYLVVKNKEGYTTTYSKGNKILCRDAQNAARLPAGHPEGIIEALANIYMESFRAMRDGSAKRKNTVYDFPTVNDGVTGMAFVETVLASAASDRKWTKMLE